MFGISVKEFAEKYGVSTRRVQVLIKEGRIPAKMVYGHKYVIDSDAVYPADDRQSIFTRRFRVQRKPVNE